MHDGYTEIRPLRLFGAPVEVHWTAFVASLVLLYFNQEDLVGTAIMVVSYFAILAVHEAGHGWVATRLGYRVQRIQLALFHGTCWYDEPDSAWDHARIAWGGVLAQVIVGVPLLALSRSPMAHELGLFSIPMTYLGPLSLLLALLNIVPGPGTDGSVAWRVFPLWWRRRSSAQAQRPKRSHLRVVK